MLLLDEPLSALDARTRASASRQLTETLRSLEVPVVLVTHEFNEAALLGDEICVIDRGSIIQRGTASELAASPGERIRRRLHRRGGAHRNRRRPAGELTIVDLDGGGVAVTTDRGRRPRRAQRVSVGDHDQPRPHQRR